MSSNDPVTLQWNADDTVTTTIRTIQKSQTENREVGMQWMQDHLLHFIENHRKSMVGTNKGQEYLEALDHVANYLKGVE